MNHTVTKLHDPNEPMLFSDSIMRNYTYELDFGNFKAKYSPFTSIKHKSETSNFTYIHLDSASKSVVNIVYYHNYVQISDSKVIMNILP